MKDRIWEAYVLRVSQEELVQAREKTMRYLARYYAVCAAAAAVLSALYPGASWHVFLTIMTVLLAVMTVFLSAGPFETRLRLIRRDIAELEALHAAAETDGSDERDIESRLQLITASGAGVSAQERRAYERVKDRSEKWQAAWDGRPARAKRLFGYEKFLYWLIEISGMILLVIAALLPAAGFALAACGLL